jgi:hypothetical protein
VGIARRVLVRGGSTGDAEIDAAVAEGIATDAIDSAADLIDLLTPSRDAATAAVS